jgi:hypothetical protein
MTRIFVKPTRPGLIVRDPKTKLALPETGKYVPDISYWWRRLNDGSIVKTISPDEIKERDELRKREAAEKEAAKKKAAEKTKKVESKKSEPKK